MVREHLSRIRDLMNGRFLYIARVFHWLCELHVAVSLRLCGSRGPVRDLLNGGSHNSLLQVVNNAINNLSLGEVQKLTRGMSRHDLER